MSILAIAAASQTVLLFCSANFNSGDGETRTFELRVAFETDGRSVREVSVNPIVTDKLGLLEARKLKWTGLVSNEGYFFESQNRRSFTKRSFEIKPKAANAFSFSWLLTVGPASNAWEIHLSEDSGEGECRRPYEGPTQ